MHIYDKFAQLCNAKGVSEPEAYKAMDINKGTISVWRKAAAEGKPVELTMGIAKKMATYFGVSVDSLIGEKNKPHAESVEQSKDEQLRFALWNGDKGITKEQIEEVKRFAEFVKERDKKNGK